jgi:hypothetical protein
VHIKHFPTPSGTIYGQAPTCFSELLQERLASGSSAFYPFEDRDEWELAETLMTSGMSLKTIDKLLKLPIVSIFDKLSVLLQFSYSVGV